MRGFRSLAALVVVLGGLLGYIYFIDSKKPVEPEGTEKKDKVFTVEADKIEGLEVTSSGGEVTKLARDKGTWQVTAPVAAKADASEVSGITTNLASVEVGGVVDDQAKDLAPYGLKQPRVAIAFTTGDKKPHRLLLGGKTPTGGDMYAQRDGEKRVVLVPAYLDSSFDRKTFDLRDKTILSFDRDKADHLELAHDDVKIELAKSGMDWMLIAPVHARADFSAVEQLVTRLQSAQMTGIEADAATDLKAYGLEKPSVVATVGAGSARATLSLGAAAPQGKTGVFARDVSRPLVALVAKDLADDLKKSVADLRRKDIFEFRPFNARRLEVTRGAETLVFEKVKGNGKDGAEKWRRTSPKPADADAGKMDALLSALSNLKAQSFADAKTPTGLDKPVATVTARFDDTNKGEKVAFGRVGADVFAGRTDEPGAARVGAGPFDEALKALDALK